MATNNANGLPKVFISVAQPDGAWASEFMGALRESSVSAQVEFNDPLATEGTTARDLASALRKSKLLVLVLSAEALKRPQLYIELGAALADHKLIIPVLTEEINERRIPGAIKRYPLLREPTPREAGQRVAALIENTLIQA